MNPFFGGQFFGGGFFGSLVGGTSKRDKKKKRVIRRSDLTYEEYQEQLEALTSQIEVRPFTPLEQAAYDLAETNDEDDELLLKVLALTIH